jgi:hypothetical protein
MEGAVQLFHQEDSTPPRHTTVLAVNNSKRINDRIDWSPQ